METTRFQQLRRQRAVAKSSLTRMQTFITTGDRKLNEIQVRFDELPNIYNKFETAQSELELSDDTDHSVDRQQFEDQYFEVKARFNELLHPVVDPSPSRHSSPRSSLSENASQSHASSVNIKLPVISLPIFEGQTCSWLHFRDTFEALIVNNTTLSNVQKFHYLIASLKDEAKDLICNLPITHDNFLVAWQLVTQRYNNKRLIAMMHAKHLCQMPQVKKGDASSLRQLINHVSSHMNALQALSLTVPVQDLMLNHLMLTTLDAETQREWELITASRADTPATLELINFMETRCRALELIQTTHSLKAAAATSRPSNATGQKVSKLAYSNVATQAQCPVCNGSHRLFKCDKFIKMQPKQRLTQAKQLGLCFNCLQLFTKNHPCSNQTCRQCHRRHHTLLHLDKQRQNSNDTRSITNNPTADAKGNTDAEVNTYCSFKGKPRTHILLATAIVEVKNKAGQYVPCRALLDSASQSHFITERCVQRLRLSRNRTHTSIQGICDVNTATHHSVLIHLRSRHTDWHTTLDCAVLSNITGITPSTKLDTSSWKIPKDIKLADEHFDQPGSIDLLMGADIFYEILRSDRRTRPGNFPVLQETALGWTLSGRTPTVSQRDPQHTFLLREDNSLEHNLNRFWEVEPVELSTMTAEQQACEEHFLTHTTQQSDGRFVVRLPTKMEPKQLGASRLSAERRLHAIERRLERDPDLKVQYHSFMKEYEELGHMEPVNSQEGKNTCYYLPHHPVFKATSTTTKTRVVFDGGAKTSNGLSLNDILQVGPTVQQDLYSIVLRFRTHHVCFTADIAKMYRQIIVHPQDRDLQRILWRYSSEEPIQEYKLTTVTYGTSSAPFLATRCLKKLADDNKCQYPRAAQVLSSDFYVDDLLSGASTIEEATKMQQELSSLLQTAGLTLRKWASNHSTFLSTIPRELQETQQTFSLENEDGVTTLGLLWNPQNDQLQVKGNFTQEQSTDSTASTKRKVLATTASIFDPLGLLSPAVIAYKIFLQKLWQDKLEWDDFLPVHLQQEWNQMNQTISKLSQIKINRKVICTNATNIQVHGFCDSSERAYGACLYIRSTNNDKNISCELLCSTSKVAPLKQLTIPRLELCATTLLSKLYKKATRALNMTIHKSYLWTDSSIVLTWIQGPPNKWKTFVGNRVATIQEETASATWRHVPTLSNPADLISRGIDPTTLSNSTLWWNGPQWLSQEPSSWPATEVNAPTENLEIRKAHVALLQPPEDLTERFSKLNKLIRVIAYCRRFINNCRLPKTNRQTTTLSTQDLVQARTCCVKMVQQISYAQEMKDLMEHQELAATSSLKTLHPFIDQEGLLRVGGRLQRSTLPYQAMHQMILPPNHHFTKLVVSAEHTRLHHAGPQLLTASLREQFWIPRIRNLVRTTIHQCLTCYKFKAQATQQLMGELPASRVQPSRPFLTTGVDYAGPIQLRLGTTRSKTITKGYIAIFVCFATKAVHIEVVTSLTSEAFLAALRRFIARRGKPRTIYSDNGTNFQGAANKLREVYKTLQSPSQMAQVQDFLATEGCDWNFIPPHAPHFGGLWEAAVKSTKHHLRRTLGPRIPTYEELCTLLTEIEACLNSRPLCAISSDPFNPIYLSPGHFLIGEPLTQLPSIDYTNVKCNSLSRWETYQQQQQQFWQSWSADYSQTLQRRQRWQRKLPNLQPGDLVLLREDNTTPLHWPTAVVTETHPGKDGVVRVVTLQTPKGIFKRPITKICPLPPANSD